MRGGKSVEEIKRGPAQSDKKGIRPNLNPFSEWRIANIPGWIASKYDARQLWSSESMNSMVSKFNLIGSTVNDLNRSIRHNLTNLPAYSSATVLKPPLAGLLGKLGRAVSMMKSVFSPALDASDWLAAAQRALLQRLRHVRCALDAARQRQIEPSAAELQQLHRYIHGELGLNQLETQPEASSGWVVRAAVARARFAQ